MTIYDFPNATEIDDALVTVEMCPCAEPDVRNRICRSCTLPNLAALMTWQFCDCPVPDLWVAGLRAQTCGICGNPHQDTLLRG